MIDSAPEIMRLAATLHEDLVRAPALPGQPAHRFGTPRASLTYETASKAIAPEKDASIADAETAILQKVLNIAQRLRELAIHQNAKLDEFRRNPEVPERARSFSEAGHPGRLPQRRPLATTVPHKKCDADQAEFNKPIVQKF